MARFNNETDYNFRAAAASAGTVTGYRAVNQTFVFTGFSWFYEDTEANADNTLDFTISYTVDGSNFTTLFSNANAVGLLNTAAPLVVNTDLGNAASGGGTGVAVTHTATRVPAGAVLRVVLVTAGTGTIPAVQMDVTGQKV